MFSKKELRPKLRKVCANLMTQPQITERLNRSLVRFLQTYPSAHWVIAGYAALDSEFDPLPALKAHCPQAKLALPVVQYDSKILIFKELTPQCRLAPNRYQILEPISTAILRPQIILIPCLGYDNAGHRLGYGGGFYDTTLRMMDPRPLSVGIALGATQIPDFPLDPWDWPLDIILNEWGIAKE
ncbi:MAG: 5-formyltetrahydrofolate cyclo-ligase [Gammaproteobacteria bacterium]|nr:5-formyltetrahydrofolate cyclo-ligase [Gammaproteobacteria bacterium]